MIRPRPGPRVRSPDRPAPRKRAAGFEVSAGDRLRRRHHHWRAVDWVQRRQGVRLDRDRRGLLDGRLPGRSALGWVELFQSWIEEPDGRGNEPLGRAVGVSTNPVGITQPRPPVDHPIRGTGEATENTAATLLNRRAFVDARESAHRTAHPSDLPRSPASGCSSDHTGEATISGVTLSARAGLIRRRGHARGDLYPWSGADPERRQRSN